MRKGVLAAAGGALLAALVTSNTAQAVPISAPAALKDASQSIALTDNVHYYGYGYGYRPYYRPYRPYYGGYGYGYRPYYGGGYGYGYYAPRPRFYIGPAVYGY